MSTNINYAYLAHPGKACQFTVSTWDSRYVRCASDGCGAVYRLPTPPAPAQGHSATSRAAAASTDRQRGRQKVWDAFRKAGQVHVNPTPWGVVGGLTDEECVEVTGMSPSTVRPRRIELVRDGLLMDSGMTRKTRANRAATIWVSVRLKLA